MQQVEHMFAVFKIRQVLMHLCQLDEMRLHMLLQFPRHGDFRQYHITTFGRLQHSLAQQLSVTP